MNATEEKVLLNQGITRESVIAQGLVEIIDQSPAIQEAFKMMRRGYPDKPFNEQCRGAAFQISSRAVLNALAVKTFDGQVPWKMTVLMPWRSGLAFGLSYEDLGVVKFYHVSSKRDEETLGTVVDFEHGDLILDHTVVIADPMLATGNTTLDAIMRVLVEGIPEDKIIVNAVVAAPIGVWKIKQNYPKVRIIVGALDESLDDRGFIVPGLGDFGDKYFAGLSKGQLDSFISQFGLEGEALKKLRLRMGA